MSDSRILCCFFFNDTPTTENYTSDTLFPYTTLFRSPIESQASSTPSHDHSPSRRLMKCKEAGDQGSRSIGSLSAGLGSRSGTICPGTLSSASLLSEGGATPSSASGSVGFSAGPAALLPDPASRGGASSIAVTEIGRAHV